MKTLSLSTLNKENFQAFGELITLEGSNHFAINSGSTERYHCLSNVDTSDENGKTIVSLFRGQGFEMPFHLKVMERHPLGTQTFIPLNPNSNQTYLIIVAPSFCSNEEELINHISCFIAKGFQGVTYGKGVWHHPLISLNQVGDFIVIDRNGPGNNCDEISITTDLVVTN